MGGGDVFCVYRSWTEVAAAPSSPLPPSPPAVYLRTGECDEYVVVSVLLTLLAWLPGVVNAFFVSTPVVAANLGGGHALVRVLALLVLMRDPPLPPQALFAIERLPYGCFNASRKGGAVEGAGAGPTPPAGAAPTPAVPAHTESSPNDAAAMTVIGSGDSVVFPRGSRGMGTLLAPAEAAPRGVTKAPTPRSSLVSKLSRPPASPAAFVDVVVTPRSDARVHAVASSAAVV